MSSAWWSAAWACSAIAVALGERLGVPRRQWAALLAVAACSVTGWHLFSAFSLVHMGGGRGAIVAYTMPVWAALFGAWYLRERLARRRVAALALGMLGIAILIGPDSWWARPQPARAAADDRRRHVLGGGDRRDEGRGLADRGDRADRLAAGRWAASRSCSPGS